MTADKGQTISRPSCLTVTVTRIFHRFTSLHWLSPDYFRWHFSHSQNTFFRDMKRSRLFVLLFYHIAALFATNTAVNKPQQTATLVDSLATHRTFSYLSSWVWWESGLVCQRRAAILRARKITDKNKISARPRVGRPLTDCALLSRFGCAERYKSVPEMYRFCCVLFAVALETVWVLYAHRACYSLP